MSLHLGWADRWKREPYLPPTRQLRDRRGGGEAGGTEHGRQRLLDASPQALQPGLVLQRGHGLRHVHGLGSYQAIEIIPSLGYKIAVEGGFTFSFGWGIGYRAVFGDDQQLKVPALDGGPA